MISALRDARANEGFARWSKRTETPLLVLAAAFLVLLLLPLFVSITPSESRIVTAASIAIWAVFALDYIARLSLALDRWHFVRTHVLDLIVVVLPMLRPLRALRIVRVLRLGSVATLAHKRVTQSHHARVTVHFVSAAIVALLVAGVAIREAERGSPEANIHSLADGLWWAATTVTTVGYGDRFPTTTLGRLIALALMLVGVALLGVITAAIATFFVDRLQSVNEELAATEERTDATLEDVLAELRAIRIRLDGDEWVSHTSRRP